MLRNEKDPIIGQPLRRREDLRLITGNGCFSADNDIPDQLYAAMVRSPHAHALILSIDAAAARVVPGVLGILTPAEMAEDGICPIPHTPYAFHPAEIPLINTDGSEIFVTTQHVFATGKVRYAGEVVAAVIATSLAAAKDGAEAVAVDYEALPVIIDTRTAVEPDTAPLFEEHANVCIDAEMGDRTATDAAFARAAHVVTIDTWIQRVTGVPMEPRAAVGVYDRETGRYTLHAGSGGAVRLKNDMAKMLHVPPDDVRVLAQDIGGNFGTRGMSYPEFAVVLWASRRLGRPVKWICERSESFLSDYQARDLSSKAELALDDQGVFLGLRGDNISNLGAFTVNFQPLQKGAEIMSSIYRMPAAYVRARAALTNTAPTRPYRSAGRPEVMYIMERLIDLAARQCGFDRVELRRLNLLTDAEMPYRNPFGMTYDGGAYHTVMEKALSLSDWAGFPKRRDDAREIRGVYRGIGVGNYIDTATGVPRERTEITVNADGSIDLVIGVVPNGQGHETSFAQLAAEWLGIPIDRIRVIANDTDVMKFGGGTHSGRGMRLASIVIRKAADEIIAKGARIASIILEVAPADIEFVDGLFFVRGTDRYVGLIEVACAAVELIDLPDDLRGPLGAVSDETINEVGFGYGCHVCEVEIDPDTGVLEIINYVAVDDVGRAINPMIIHGQTHGGIAQGVGQALWEHCAYDPASGQLLSGSFMDYAMPRADMLPTYITEISEVPSRSHPLGIRPGGEGGTTPSLGVVANAISDALGILGVNHIEMPATSERIWRAIQAVKRLNDQAASGTVKAN